jgi:hypothetical protein
MILMHRGLASRRQFSLQTPQELVKSSRYTLHQ